MVERVGNSSVCVCTLWNLEDFGLLSRVGSGVDVSAILGMHMICIHN